MATNSGGKNGSIEHDGEPGLALRFKSEGSFALRRFHRFSAGTFA
jgi:hypothetical protein